MKELLAETLVFSKKPKGPAKQTMRVYRVRLYKEGQKDNAIYKVVYTQSMFNIYKALRADGETIKKLSSKQIENRIIRYITFNLRFSDLMEKIDFTSINKSESEKRFKSLSMKLRNI